MSRLGARVGLVAAAFLALAVAAPLVAADHAYSHRYIIYGRVVDANGDAVPGLTVNLQPRDFTPEGGCTNQPGTDTEAFGRTETRPVTNQYGEFIYCFHTHSMSRTLPGTAAISVPQANYTTTVQFDAYVRTNTVTIQLPEVRSEANKEALATSYLVNGRLWRPLGGEPRVEGIRVFGETLNHVPVEITVTLPNGSTLARTVETNSYGDFAVRFNTTERLTSGTVKIVSQNQTFEKAIDGTYGITSFRAEYAKQSDPFLRNLFIVLGVIAVVIVGGGGAWWASRRMKEKREEARTRERSQRKRANK